jgi:hypothetical protein
MGFWVIFSFIIGTKVNGSISGVVIDKLTNKKLVGVYYMVLGTKFGGTTDTGGCYMIENLPVGEYKIKFSMIGYKTLTLTINVQPSKNIVNVALEPTALSLSPVVISGEQLAEKSCVSDHLIKGHSFSLREGHMQDPIRVLYTLPGITARGDLFSSSQLYVRGGAPDENLFLLDWTQVHWPWYFGGMKSIFNSEVIEKIELLTGGFPAKYGDCLSSVLNVTTREGNREYFKGEISLGFINSQVIMEGPITKQSSYLLAYRRTYLDLVLEQESQEFPVPSFWDLNCKVSYEPKVGQKLYFSSFFSDQKVDFTREKVPPGMPKKVYDKMKLHTQSIEWKNIINPRIYSIFALTREKINWEVEIGRIMKLTGDAITLGIMGDITWQLSSSHEIKCGFDLGYANLVFQQSIPIDFFNPNIDVNDTTTPTKKYEFKGKLYSKECYIQDSWEVLKKVSLTGGINLHYLDYNKNLDLTPRISVQYKLNDKTNFRTAYGYYSQNPPLEYLSKEKKLDSKKAIHYICGVTRKFNNQWRGWIEVYYKKYFDLITLDTNENYFNNGKGYAQGVELFLEKKEGKLEGWLSYSLGISKRRELFDTVESYTNFDQRHMISIVMDWHFLKNWSVDIQFRYASPRPYTPIIGAYQDTLGVWFPIRGATNSARYNSFHQVNVRIVHYFTIFKFKGAFYFEVWNLYNRKNIMGYVYEYSDKYENNVKKIPYYSTPFIPGGGFKIKF